MESRCEICAELKNGRTVLTDTYYTPPFKIMRPFVDGKETTVMLMTASAGILSGDRYSHRYTVGPGADLAITGQGYTKVFQSTGEPCGQHLEMQVAAGGTLKYLPLPVIPFAGSDYGNEIHAELAADSTFVCADIMACGRSGAGERFLMKRYASRMEVYVEGELAFLDNTRILPAEIDYEGMGFFEGHSHMGTMYLYLGGDAEREIALIHQIRTLLEQSQTLSAENKARIGVSRAKRGVLVRVLADSGETIEKLFKDISNMGENA